MASRKWYYFVMLDENKYILGRGRCYRASKPASTSTFVVITQSEYDVIGEVLKNKPEPSDSEHTIKVRMNDDGTYDYVEVEIIVEETEEI